MKYVHHQCQHSRLWGLAIAACFVALLSIIPIRLAIACHQAPFPQAILVLGGGKEREIFGAKFAQAHPSLDIWVSSGIRPDKTREIFQAAKVPSTKLHIDCRAVDTVTNFTTVLADLKAREIQHLYLITANFHMTRARAISTIIFGSQGITITPVPIHDLRPDPEHPPESWSRTLRDSVRAIFWIGTGRTGSSLNPSPVNQCS